MQRTQPKEIHAHICFLKVQNGRKNDIPPAGCGAAFLVAVPAGSADALGAAFAFSVFFLCSATAAA